MIISGSDVLAEVVEVAGLCRERSLAAPEGADPHALKMMLALGYLWRNWSREVPPARLAAYEEFVGKLVVATSENDQAVTVEFKS